jgi:hypothetical protein
MIYRKPEAACVANTPLCQRYSAPLMSLIQLLTGRFWNGFEVGRHRTASTIWLARLTR